jgi:hypothetical protein
VDVIVEAGRVTFCVMVKVVGGRVILSTSVSIAVEVKNKSSVSTAVDVKYR